MTTHLDRVRQEKEASDSREELVQKDLEALKAAHAKLEKEGISMSELRSRCDKLQELFNEHNSAVETIKVDHKDAMTTHLDLVRQEKEARDSREELVQKDLEALKSAHAKLEKEASSISELRSMC